MLFALLSAFSNVIATTVNKFLLSRDKMSVSSFGIWLFILLTSITALSLPWLGWVDYNLLLSPVYLFYFFIMVGLAVIWNIFFYRAMQQESLSEFQLITVIQPLLTILLSLLIFNDERGERVIIATLIGGSVLILSHLHRWQIENPVLTIPLMGAIILSAIENLFIKEMLVVTSPAALYFLRTFFVAIILFAATPTAIRLVNRRHFYRTFIIAFFAVLTMVLSFYGYQTIGVAKTNIILLLGPIGTTILSVILLKERVKKRKILAFIIIVLCIIYVFVDGG